LVTKNARQTPLGARSNREDKALKRKKLSLVSPLGEPLELKCEFKPREMTSLMTEPGLQII